MEIIKEEERQTPLLHNGRLALRFYAKTKLTPLTFGLGAAFSLVPHLDDKLHQSNNGDDTKGNGIQICENICHSLTSFQTKSCLARSAKPSAQLRKYIIRQILPSVNPRLYNLKMSPYLFSTIRNGMGAYHINW